MCMLILAAYSFDVIIALYRQYYIILLQQSFIILPILRLAPFFLFHIVAIYSFICKIPAVMA